MSIDRQQAFSGTKEAAGTLRLDAARLEAFLTAQIEGFAGPMTIKQFKGGQSNPTYLLETPARRYVLRRKPPGKLLPSAHAVDREYRVISALHAQDFPVAARQFPAPAGDAAGARLYDGGAVALPGLVFVDDFAVDSGAAMGHENEAWQRRQPEFDILGAGQDIFIKPKHGMHSVS